MKSLLLACMLLGSSMGCASLGKGASAEQASKQFLQAWEEKRYDQMYASLGESYQREVPFSDFHSAFTLIHSTLGPLRHYEYRPIHRNHRVIDRYDLIFQRSAGHLVFESSPGGGTRIGEIRFYTAEADQSPLEEELTAFGLEVPANHPITE